MIIRVGRENIDIDFDAIELKDLHDLYGRLEEEKLAIEGQIAGAKATLLETGEYADPKWYQMANVALKNKNVHLETIRREIGRIKRGERGKQKLPKPPPAGIVTETKLIESLRRSHAVIELFLSIVKEQHPEIYKACMNQALEEIKSQVQEIKRM
jgi:hypothetical protein